MIYQRLEDILLLGRYSVFNFNISSMSLQKKATVKRWMHVLSIPTPVESLVSLSEFEPFSPVKLESLEEL